MAKQDSENIVTLNREMGHQRATLAKLVQQLRGEEERLDRAVKQYGELERTVGELSAEATRKRQQIFALKMELEARQRERVRIKTPGEILFRPRDVPVDPMFGEKRANVRAPFAPHVTFGGLKDLYSGFAINISDGGLLVATCDPPALGRRFAIEFDIGGVHGHIRCPVEAVWLADTTNQDEAGYSVAEVGLRFLALTEADKVAVRGFAVSYLSALNVRP